MLTSATIYFSWSPCPRTLQWISGRRVNDDWTLDEAGQEVLAVQGYPISCWFGPNKPGAYEPFKTATGLFREFAATEPTRDGIHAFATKYGPLTYGRLYVPDDIKRRFPKPPRGCNLAHWYLKQHSVEAVEADEWALRWLTAGARQGDSLEYWQSNIRKLRALVRVWDALTAQDRKAIAACTRLEEDGGVKRVSILDLDGTVIDGPRKFSAKDAVGLTQELAAECALHSALSAGFGSGAIISLYPPESNNRCKLAIVPTSLRDAIWLQFGLAVIENKKFGACEVCGKQFEFSPQVARTNRRLCSMACKQKAHRQRHEQALSLAALGRTPRQIAKQVGSKLSTVEKWLEEVKRGE